MRPRVPMERGAGLAASSARVHHPHQFGGVDIRWKEPPRSEAIERRRSRCKGCAAKDERSLSGRLRDLMTARECSVADVAANGGLPKSAVEKCLGGRSKPNFDVISAICRGCGASADGLVPGSEAALDEKGAADALAHFAARAVEIATGDVCNSALTAEDPIRTLQDGKRKAVMSGHHHGQAAKASYMEFVSDMRADRGQRRPAKLRKTAGSYSKT